MKSTHDIVVIGAGSGGLVGARFAARLGARVALVEKSRIGGDCTWTGCVPSKALLRAAKAAHAVREAGKFGIDVPAPVVDMAPYEFGSSPPEPEPVPAMTPLGWAALALLLLTAGLVVVRPTRLAGTCLRNAILLWPSRCVSMKALL